jgi:hypothetical protein
MKPNTLSLVLFALLTYFVTTLGVDAVSPAPDGCYPNFTTAEGCNALNSLNTGAGNTALGWYALATNIDGSFNTGVGSGALTLTTGGSNTAVGAAALLLNNIGSDNTAVGTDALVMNDAGSSNEAMGSFALASNVGGAGNVAIGDRALIEGRDNYNTAIGFQAGQNLIVGTENIYIGDRAGTYDAGDESNTIRIGSIYSGNNACFIQGIASASIPTANAAPVYLDVTTGQLATILISSDGSKVSSSISTATEPQAMLNSKVQELQKQVEALTAQLREQAARIQKVSAQLEQTKSAPQTVCLPAVALREAGNKQ